jgi:hypothetical protein
MITQEQQDALERWLDGKEVGALLAKSEGCRRRLAGLVSAYLREDVVDELKEEAEDKS